MEPTTLIWGMEPIKLILGGILGFYVCLQVIVLYLEDKNQDVIQAIRKAPQPLAATEETTQPARLLSFIKRIRTPKVEQQSEHKKAA